MTPGTGTALAFLLGLCVGSFLNVVIARLPEGRSLLTPGSSCPRCGHAIRWHDNIPVLSGLWLGLKCRDCRAPISWRYPAVEVLTGLLFAQAVAVKGVTPPLASALVLSALLVAITFIDLDRQIIPDLLSVPGIALGLAASLVTGHPHWLDSLVGILVGGAIFFMIIVASRGGMGGGDMKLGAMLGAFLGWKVLLVAVLSAVLLGGVVAIFLLVLGRKGRKDPVPFGPFLALGGLIGLFWGEGIIRWYLGAFIA